MWDAGPPSSLRSDVLRPGLDDVEPGPILAAWLSEIDVGQLSGYDRVVVLRAHQRLASHYQGQVYADMAAVSDVLSTDDPVGWHREWHSAVAVTYTWPGTSPDIRLREQPIRYVDHDAPCDDVDVGNQGVDERDLPHRTVGRSHGEAILRGTGHDIGDDADLVTLDVDDDTPDQVFRPPLTVIEGAALARRDHELDADECLGVIAGLDPCEAEDEVALVR